MTRNPLDPRRILSALVITCCIAGLAPAVASAAPGPVPVASQGHKKHKAKLDASVEKTKVKAGETTKVKGNFADLSGMESVSSGEPLIVQRLQGGVWVDVASGTCRPNGHYSLSITLSIRASLSLRVFHPETDLYLSVTSNIFALVVI